MSAHTQLAAKQATDPNSLLQIRNTRRIQFTVADPQVRGPLALCDHSCRSTRRLARSNACTPCLAQSPTVCASVCIARTSRPRLAYGIPQPAQGNSAVIAVTGIATNRAPARCECRTVWGCNCTVPDATYLGNGTLLLMPQALLPVPTPRGRIFRVSYNATVAATGLSCQGVVDICSIAGGG